MANEIEIARHFRNNQAWTFYHNVSEDTVNVEIEGKKGRFNVHCPELLFPTPLSTADKIHHLLQNFHLQPIVENEAIHFEQTSPQSKAWELYRTLKLPENARHITYHLNGTISYSCYNTLTTWNWENDKLSIYSPNLHRITAIGEQINGEPIFGDEEGNLFLKNSPSINLGQEITGIHSISKGCILVCLKNKEASFVYLSSGNVCGDKILKNIEKAVVFKNGKIAISSEKIVTIYELKGQELYQLNQFEADYIRGVSESYLGFAKSTKKRESNCKHEAGLYNTQLNQIEFERKVQSGEISIHDTHYFQFSQPQSFLAPYNRNGVWFGNRDNCYSYATKAKFGINSILTLSDGSIMYTSHTDDSLLYLMTKEGETFYNDNKRFTGNRDVSQLTELKGGAVAMQFNNCIQVIRPYSNEKSLYQHMKELKLEGVKQGEEEEGDKLDRYNVALECLKVSSKAGNMYVARRLYEKARKLRPENRSATDFFLSLLQQAPNSKLKRRLYLDRFHLDHASFPEQLTRRKTKKRLLVGEADFSYTEALINKHKKTHPHLSKSIIATELKNPKDETVQDKIALLLSEGVKVMIGIDGTTLHKTFKGKRFKRIQWNCPFGESDSCARAQFKNVIPEFFQSCNHLQLPGDRVHVTLMQSGNYFIQRQKENPIVAGSHRAGYRLIRKRNFGAGRYPGYKHVKTDGYIYQAGGVEREFVFEKINFFPPQKPTFKETAETYKNPNEKEYEVKLNGNLSNPQDYYFECSTDEDSSDYYDSDSDSETESVFKK